MNTKPNFFKTFLSYFLGSLVGVQYASCGFDISCPLGVEINGQLLVGIVIGLVVGFGIYYGWSYLQSSA